MKIIEAEYIVRPTPSNARNHRYTHQVVIRYVTEINDEPETRVERVEHCGYYHDEETAIARKASLDAAPEWMWWGT